MKLIKSVFALVLAAVILLTAFFFWHRLSEKKFGAADKAVVDNGQVQTTAPVDMTFSLSGFTLTVTQEQLGVILQQAISSKLRVRQVGTAIGEHNAVSLTCRADTRQLVELMKKQGELPRTLELALKILPEYTEVDLSAVLMAEDGALQMMPTEFGLLGLSLGASHLPQSFTDTVNENLKNAFAGSFTSVTSVTTSEGLLELTGTFD